MYQLSLVNQGAVSKFSTPSTLASSSIYMRIKGLPGIGLLPESGEGEVIQSGTVASELSGLQTPADPTVVEGTSVAQLTTRGLRVAACCGEGDRPATVDSGGELPDPNDAGGGFRWGGGGCGQGEQQRHP